MSTMLLLGLVLIVGEARFGGQRWLLNGSIQPSEIAKLSIIITVIMVKVVRIGILNKRKLNILNSPCLVDLQDYNLNDSFSQEIGDCLNLLSLISASNPSLLSMGELPQLN